MNDIAFKDGQKLKRIVLSDLSTIYVGAETDSGPVEKITVVVEHGQAPGAPWFAVWVDGKIKSKWNGAFIHAAVLI